MRSLSRYLILATLFAPSGLCAQTILFQEDFETNGQFSMSPQWVWNGNAPVPDQAAACSNSSWGIHKDVHGPSDVSWGHYGARWMFHPIPILPFTMYQVTVKAGGVTWNTGSMDVSIAMVWWDPALGNPSSLGGGWVVEPTGCISPMSVFEVPQAPPAGMPNAQFGVLIYGENYNTDGGQMLLDKIVVRTQPWKARFRGSVLLGGAYDGQTGLMRDDLRQQGLVPLTEPYTALGWPQVSGGGGETVTPAVLNATYGSGGHVVDWVRLELRSRYDASQVVATRQALVLQNGTVIGTDGSGTVTFDIVPDVYYVSVRHRNHLGARTLNYHVMPEPSAVSDLGIQFSSASPEHACAGTDARQNVGGRMVLWPGDVTSDHVVKYTGADNDRDPILLRVGGTVPTNTVNGYYSEDVTLDGVVKYTGANNDRDPILVTVGATVPTATRTEQIP